MLTGTEIVVQLAPIPHHGRQVASPPEAGPRHQVLPPRRSLPPRQALVRSVRGVDLQHRAGHSAHVGSGDDLTCVQVNQYRIVFHRDNTQGVPSRRLGGTRTAGCLEVLRIFLSSFTSYRFAITSMLFLSVEFQLQLIVVPEDDNAGVYTAAAAVFVVPR